MDISELSTQDFTLRDGLVSADVLALEQIRGALEMLGHAPPNGADALAELEQEVQRGAIDLFQRTHDVQAWVVLIEVLVATGLTRGVSLALQTMNKGLGQAWEGLEIAARGARDPNTAVLRLGRHVEGLLGRLYEQLSSLRERQPERLLRLIEGNDWTELLQSVEISLTSRKLSGANWGLLKSLLQTSLEETHPPEAVEFGASSSELAASGATARTSLPVGPSASAATLVDSLGDAGGSANGMGTPLAANARAGAADGGVEHVTLRVSKEFVELRRRLDAFQVLLGRKDFEKAALVAAELSECLGRFDVTAFFPDLFAGLFEGQVGYAAELEPFSQRGEGMRERSLRQLYRTALERFLDDGLGASGHGR